MRKILNIVVRPMAHLQIVKPLAAFSAAIVPGAVVALGVTAGLIASTRPAIAQSMFSPAIVINEEAITYYELEQRALFLTLLRAPGDPLDLAREALIEDRLKQQLIQDAGIKIAPEDVELGIEEMAARTELTSDQFIKVLNDGGVSRETLRDFVEVGIAWREYVTARFLAGARPTPSEIDRALGRAGGGGGVRVKLAEIIIPVTPQTVDQAAGLAQEIANVTTNEAFSAAAAQYSASDTRSNGGVMDWIPINNLPAGLRPVILALSPGDVTSPITLPNAVALFQMRGLQEISSGAPRYTNIDYAVYYVAGGRSAEARSKAQSIAQQVDVCDDLYGIAKGQPPEVLERVSKAPGQIPRDIALELAKLDEGETSTTLTSANGQSLVLLMLCSRTASLSDDEAREEIANALTQQRINALADSLLDQTRAEALIAEQ